METEIVTITAYDENGGLVETRTVRTQRDGERVRAVADYRTATGALMASSASPVIKTWVRALNAMLRRIVSELEDTP